MSRDHYLLHDVPADLRLALWIEARERDASLNDVIASALAAELGLDYRSIGYGVRPGMQGGSTIYLRLPAEVMDAVRHAAHERGITLRSMLLLLLAAHFGTEEPPLRKAEGRGRPRVRP